MKNILEGIIELKFGIFSVIRKNAAQEAER